MVILFIGTHDLASHIGLESVNFNDVDKPS